MAPIRYLVVCLLVLFPCAALAAPSVSFVSGTVSHGESIVISGSDFGVKSPAAPLIWDDGEDKTVESDSAVSQVWDEVMPWVGGASVTSHRTRYRSAPHENTEAPHSHSNQFLCGGHYTFPNNDPPYIGSGAGSYRSVGLTVDNGSASSQWFGIWYYRVNPSWANPCPPANNHKTDVLNTTGVAYGGAFSYNVYNSFGACLDGQAQLNINHGSTGCDPHQYYQSDNPRLDWVHYEYRIRSDSQIGLRDVYFNNQIAGGYDSNCPNWKDDIRSFTVGGYYRWSTNGSIDTSTFRGYSSGTDSNPVNLSFRYFDDIYIDTTLARVMLANDATYENASIIEPQIPSAWASGEITVTVNQGKLPDGTAYLFVFDSDNDANATGYEVTLDGSTAIQRAILFRGTIQ